MFLRSFEIKPEATVSEIVLFDYRTSEVFQKYNIEYCCGGKFPLSTACMMKGLDLEEVKKELEKTIQISQLPAKLDFENWDIDFLTHYIVNVHHSYLKKELPVILGLVADFMEDHEKKYPQMRQVHSLLTTLQEEMIPHMEYKELVVFSYIHHLYTVYQTKDPFGKVLVTSLQKSMNTMTLDEQSLSSIVLEIRGMLNNYTAPDRACISHKVALYKLKELDYDVMQHSYLENSILYPKVIKLEKSILQ